MLFRLCFFCLGKLMFEPTYHPKTAVDLQFQAVSIRDGSRVGGDQWDEFDIFAVGGIDRSGRPVAEAGNMRLQTAGTDYLAGFIGSCCDQW